MTRIKEKPIKCTLEKDFSYDDYTKNLWNSYKYFPTICTPFSENTNYYGS
jgi:hypothetical protein